MNGPIDSLGDYVVERRPRRRTIGLSLDAEGSLKVMAPAHVPDSVVHAFVRSRRDWVEKKRRQLAVRREELAARNYRDGEVLEVLGRPRRIICRLCGSPQLLPGEIKLHLPQDAPQTEVCSALRTLLIQAAAGHFAARAQHYACAMELKPSSIGIKTYRSRWGSCHPDGRIYLSWRLMLAPEWIGDYVVVHELAHLRHANHSSAFHALVARFHPQAVQARTWLRQHAWRLDL